MKLKHILPLILALILIITPVSSIDEFEFEPPELDIDWAGSELGNLDLDFNGNELGELNLDFDGSEIGDVGAEPGFEDEIGAPGFESGIEPGIEDEFDEFDDFSDIDDFDHEDIGVLPLPHMPDIDAPVNPFNQPAKWNTLQKKIIPKGSPDGTLVYEDLALQCTDPDDPVVMSVISQHSSYSLAFSNFDLVINDLDPNYTGAEFVTLICNGVEASFVLEVEGPNDQAVWNQLRDKVIKQGSPDDTVVYKDLALQCTDPDDPVVMSVISAHDNYDLAFLGFNLVIRNLDPAYTGVEEVKLTCNGAANSFKLHVVPEEYFEEDEEEDSAKLKIFISSIRIPEAYDLMPGEVFPVRISFKNDGNKQLENVKAVIVVQELGIRTSIGPMDIPAGRKISRTLLVELPQDIQPGTYPVRITIQNNEIKRVVYREIDVIEE